MSDSSAAAGPDIRAGMPLRRDHDLRARFENLRALNSAWTVLAPFGLSEEGRHIVETGRLVSEHLDRLAAEPAGASGEARLADVDRLLDGIRGEMLALALAVPVSELRSALPVRLPEERRGVLDLLDLVLIAVIEEGDASATPISAVDYLVTLLSTGDPETGAERVEDPVRLTPRLHALCARAEGDEDPVLKEIEAEFREAENLCDEDARDEIRQRVLRRRKRELGARFFAPRVLRAIVDYNAALSRRIDAGVRASRDWGSLGGEPAAPSAEGSVFETDVLPELARALRRRAQDGTPTSSPIDRVAWCLDLGSLGPPERSALRARGVGTSAELGGTAILVGLLYRSAVVLEDEFPGIGISPETLRQRWVPELDAELQRAISERIGGDAYQHACALSKLRSDFLCLLRSGESAPPPRRPAPRRAPPAHEEAPARHEARRLVRRALTETPTVGARPTTRAAGLVRLAGSRTRLVAWAGCAALVIATLVFLLVPRGDLDRMSRDELARVSPYLSAGARNGEGAGPAFVGTIGDAWSSLAPSEQSQAANDLVRGLREQGVRDVMVYDRDRRLRIQALGRQPARILPAPRS